jgi:tetratricopeptide (TPR) repeat protein
VPVLPDEDAVALFVARARAARRDFELTPANQPAVDAICARLDGLPLAIELVAARSRELAVDDMLAALPRTLELAARGPRDLPTRQRTLRATVEWSYELLDSADARVFRRLACFAGGWDAETGREVAGATDEQNKSLIERSLVIGGDVADRFAMLATIREFASERLDGSGEADEVYRRHAEHFRALASEVDTQLRAGGDQGALLEALEQEHDNLRAAVAWAAAYDEKLELALVADAATFWIVRGHWAEGERLLAAALGRASRDDAVRAKALTGAGVLARYRGEYDVARRELQRASDIYERLGEWPGMVRALTNLGFTEVTVGDPDRARACYEGALAAAERSGSPRDRNQSLNCLADLALREGDWDRAQQLSVEGLALAHETADSESVGVCMMNRAQAALALDRPDETLELATAALDAWAPLKDPAHLALCFDALAFGLAGKDADAAAVLLGASAGMRGDVGAELDELERMVRDRAERAVADALPVDSVESATTKGRGMSLEDAIGEARAASARVT